MSVKSHRESLAKLKDDDPEFFEFLSKEDKGLLEFDDVDDDDDDDDDDDMSDDDSEEKAEESENSDDNDDSDDSDGEGPRKLPKKLEVSKNFLYFSL